MRIKPGESSASAGDGRDCRRRARRRRRSSSACHFSLLSKASRSSHKMPSFSSAEETAAKQERASHTKAQSTRHCLTPDPNAELPGAPPLPELAMGQRERRRRANSLASGTEGGSTPAAIRTRDPQLRRLLLYPTELPEREIVEIVAGEHRLGKPNFAGKSGKRGVLARQTGRRAAPVWRRDTRASARGRAPCSETAPPRG